jgi:hypothetical protein
MPRPIQLDHIHCQAICDEIGDQLRISLSLEPLGAPPERLQRLLKQLIRSDAHHIAPSVVPSIRDMARQATRGKY